MQLKGVKREAAGAFSAVMAIIPFRHLWLSQLFSQIASSMLLFVLALRVYQTTGSNTAVSGLFLAHGIPALAFGLIGGTIVDKLDKRYVLLVCDILRSVLVISLIFFGHQIIYVYIAVLINSLITQFYVPAEAPTIPMLVPNEKLVTANSLFSFTYFSSLAVGSVLAGPLLRILGDIGGYGLIATCFLIASVFVSRLPNDLEKDRKFRSFLHLSPWYLISRVMANLKEGVSYMYRSHELFDALVLLTGTQIILAILGAIGPGFADRVLNIDVRDASVLITGPVVLGIVIGALWLGNHKKQLAPHKLINIGILGAGIMLTTIALIVRIERLSFLSAYDIHGLLVPVALGLFFLLGFSNSLLDVPANSILQESAQGDMRSRVYGMLTAAVGGAGILPVILGGLLADSVGPGKVILLLGVVVVAYGVFRVRYNKITK